MSATTDTNTGVGVGGGVDDMDVQGMAVKAVGNVLASLEKDLAGLILLKQRRRKWINDNKSNN